MAKSEAVAFLAGMLVLGSCGTIGFDYQHYGMKMPLDAWDRATALGDKPEEDLPLQRLCQPNFQGNDPEPFGNCTVMTDEEFNRARRDVIKLQEDLKACQEQLAR